ncbi:fungal-specific transcription factor domain-containing protein [Talaromyces proteolyticus]|uniref:Fungal-specific transcription factor domain-containing protein n=1 Tax=Talaromyces proteolyticus TaxID=1131652 RepID=A0AAD4Q2R7_9EURO|nr:fungal-specific transcription factor domain-containing protein [Talaromyces proteolyticus]KAH8700656.1 fungal-specific transcription factor domain-containing protein [Talaromyces proteolyticus]
MQQDSDDAGREENTPTWRAIKCDKRSPCSNCRASDIVCRTASRPKEQRQRILISDQYEKKIEVIESRLARIETLLENLASLSAAVVPSRPSAAATASNSPSHSSKIETVPPPPSSSSSTTFQLARTTRRDAKPKAAFEGDSSLRAHSMHASRVIESAMNNDTGFGSNTEMQDALFALRNLIEKQHSLSANQDYRFPHQQGDASTLDLSSIKMPAMESVVSLLRICKETQNFLDLPFIDFEQFNELCRKVYFATEDYSMATFTLVNGGLYHLFNGLAGLQVPNFPEASENAAICRANLEYALTRFSIFTAPTSENLQALLIGASYAIDISQPSLCWALTSTAARLCQTLGYHRSVVSPGDNPLDMKLKTRMFWFTYILDKCLSLRLGHSSILQDFDITLALPEPSDDSKLSMWDTMYQHWVKIGYFQGRIYEELYSPRSLSGPASDRTQRAKQIVGDMQLWYQEIAQIDPSRAYNPVYYEAAASSSEIMYYALSTLAYRVVPPGPLDHSPIFSNGCIETARAALRAHQLNSERYKNSSYIWHGYISWVLINCPFTPFMVLFCHAIATANLADLQCLGDFVASLHCPGEAVEAAERLRRLCQVFHRVADLYIKTKIKQQEIHHPHLHPDNAAAAAVATNHPQEQFAPPKSPHSNANDDALPNFSSLVTDDFEPYLSALGFPNAAGFLNIGDHNNNNHHNANNIAAPAAAEDYNGVNDTIGSWLGGDSFSLENWFTGNVNIMSLVETDLSGINPPGT